MAVYTTIEPVKAEMKQDLFGGDVRKVTLRPEQEQAVRDAFKYFKRGRKHPKFLWNAKMRFGKTLCALDLARRMSDPEKGMNIHRTLIVTHRPVVKKSWKEDFEKIFGEHNPDYSYGTKFDEEGEGDFYTLEQKVKDEGHHYIFFASLQYLRRSDLVGGDNSEQLKKDILTNDWDLVVIDEAHEGTRTNLGQAVIDRLTGGASTHTLHLSGTPFNLYEDFEDDQIYTWDYIKEQTAKREWPREHPDQPAVNNPYRELPEMEIRTYDLGNIIRSSLGEGAAFQFKEFFRTRQGQNVPKEEKGRFVYEEEVNKFLDLLCKVDDESHYPFSTDEYRRQFNHTLWVVPGVKEAKALETLLHEHDTFQYFDVINVAGNNEDDEAREDALDKVLGRIGNLPEQTYTITLSCGRLTTGVTVKPWTAVFYLKGSENMSAATYMQTIFRVQSPYTYEDDCGQLRMKTKCYVFDFAPDRSVRMVAETAKFATIAQTARKRASAAVSNRNREEEIENMRKFLSFCPVLSMEGGRMVEFRAERLFEQLAHVYVDRVVRNGFNDNSLYDIRALMQLAPDEIEELDKMGVEIGKTTNMEKPKRAKNIDVAKNNLSARQRAAAERAHRKQREGKPLTPEEQAALEAEKKRKEEERKERDNRITILRGISLRIPLMMYGADIEDEEEGITLDNFTRVVDDASWAEFMPRGVDKAAFRKFRKCYNATVFVAAGKRYRQLAREADRMTVHERVQRISEIFSYFHNPDKETVLTPWRVVNMHMSDTLGGYAFFNESFTGPCEKQVPGHDGRLFDWEPTTEPRFVDRGAVTAEVFGRSEAKILEINSKTGLYPLYVAYSLYRRRCADFVKAGLIDDPDNYSVEEEQVIWDDILAGNIYVVCNTPMARRITHRTLLGFRHLRQKNGTEQVNIKSEELISRATNDRESLIKDLLSEGFWRGDKRNKNMLKFAAVVGNPPYQQNDGGGTGSSAVPLYNEFVGLAKDLKPSFISMIMPAKWFSGGRGLDSFRQEMLNDTHLKSLYDFDDSRECFPTVDIAGGICYFLWEKNHDGMCDVVSVRQGDRAYSVRYLNEFDDFIRDQRTLDIIKKVSTTTSRNSLSQKVYASKPFGIRSFDRGSESPALPGRYVRLFGSAGITYVKFEDIPQNAELTPKWKVIMSKASAEHAGQSDKEGRKRIVSRLEVLPPDTICTESYLLLDVFDSEEDANNLKKYIQTQFVRFLLGSILITQNIVRDKFKFVPLQDFTSSSDIDWSQSIADIDRRLYKKYGLSADEVSFIERMIKPME